MKMALWTLFLRQLYCMKKLKEFVIINISLKIVLVNVVLGNILINVVINV